MPETKINVRSPFPLKYQASNLVYVELEVYVYSGTKTVDKGDRKYYFKKYPIDGNDYVVFELAEIIRDYLVPDNNLLSNDVSDYVKWVQIEDSIVTEYIPDCTDISGFAVAQDGTITYPTSSSSDTIISKVEFRADADFNPGSETTPPSFGANTSGSDISRQATAYIKIPSGYHGYSTQDKLCVLTADQPSAATAYCKTYRVTNSSSTETGSLSYTSCDGQQSIVYTIPTNSTIDICVYPADPYTFGVPTISGSGVSYIDLNQFCTTDTLS